jgi:cytochrome c-type biogenesis protein CcmH/NrfG
VRQLNKELGARYVLEGSVQRSGDALRVTAQLLDAKDGTHLWAESYDRDLSASSIFAVQDEITEQVVATIASFWGVISRARFAEVREKPTGSLEAYESVLRTSAYFRSNLGAPEHARLRDALERAVKSDPGYAEAWACLSMIYLDEDRLSYNPRPDPLDRAMDAAQQAIALDSTSQLAHHALAAVHFQRHELDAFFAQAERAIALNPNNAALVGGMGMRFHQAGDERGIPLVEKAMKLDPFAPTGLYFPIAVDHFEKREYEEALAAVRKINIPGFFLTQVFLAAIYAEMGREREARAALEELLRLRPGYTIRQNVEEGRKINVPESRRRLFVAALRKAGLPE